MTDFSAIIRIVVSITLVLAWRSLLRQHRFVAHTSLVSAWYWGVIAAALWSATWIVGEAFRIVPQSLADHLWYASSVVALCPCMAVLGSRRPGVRVWTAFIQIPMLFVLGWPAIALILQGQEIRGIQLETPQVIGFLLVLLMGAGNYLGTRSTFASLFYAVALGLIVVSSSAVAPQFLSDRETSRILATGVIALAVLSFNSATSDVAPHPVCLASDAVPSDAALGAGLLTPPNPDRFDRIWLDFLNLFGVVWGRRIQDRINHIAVKEKWPGRLELHGFEWTSSPDPKSSARIEHTFRWLLRRFVDPPWIDDRMESASPQGEVSAMTTDS